MTVRDDVKKFIHLNRWWIYSEIIFQAVWES